MLTFNLNIKKKYYSSTIVSPIHLSFAKFSQASTVFRSDWTLSRRTELYKILPADPRDSDFVLFYSTFHTAQQDLFEYLSVFEDICQKIYPYPTTNSKQ